MAKSSNITLEACSLHSVACGLLLVACWFASYSSWPVRYGLQLAAYSLQLVVFSTKPVACTLLIAAACSLEVADSGGLLTILGTIAFSCILRDSAHGIARNAEPMRKRDQDVCETI